MSKNSKIALSRLETFLKAECDRLRTRFVQHMISVLKNNGRMAVVMPHGVLFRGGEEQKVRERLIGGSTTNPSCILECVIGLPQGLFYGTGIPASLLIINKKGAADREGVFFINADREYKEGKNQNSLRPEDIEKISYVYHNKLEIAGYSRLVTKDELFTKPKEGFADFTSKVSEKSEIKNIVSNSDGKTQVLDNYANAIDSYWNAIADELNALHNGSAFEFSKRLTESFVAALGKLNVLNEHQVRGSFANFMNTLRSDFRSVQASGWTAELIPDDELIANEFPEVLEDLKRLEARRDELDAKFAEIAEIDSEEWDAEQYEVMPKTVISDIKNEIKELKAKRKELAKHQKALEKQGKMGVNVADELQKCHKDVADIDVQISDKEQGIAHHIALENELKECKKQIREIEKSKEALADKAREQISDDDARTLITVRWLKTLHDTISQYLEAHARTLQQCVELLYDKYSVTLGMLVSERQQATDELDGYLKELGYKL